MSTEVLQVGWGGTRAGSAFDDTVGIDFDDKLLERQARHYDTRAARLVGPEELVDDGISFLLQ
jgi:hypothetical protein